MYQFLKIITFLCLLTFSVGALTGEYISTNTESGSSTGKMPIEKIEFTGSSAIITQGGAAITCTCEEKDGYATLRLNTNSLKQPDIIIAFKIEKDKIICKSEECLGVEFKKYEGKIESISIAPNNLKIKKPQISKSLQIQNYNVHISQRYADTIGEAGTYQVAGILKMFAQLEGKTFKEIALDLNDLNIPILYVNDRIFEKQLRTANSDEERFQIVKPFCKLFGNLYYNSVAESFNQLIEFYIMNTLRTSPYWFNLFAKDYNLNVSYNISKLKPLSEQDQKILSNVNNIDFRVVVTDKDWNPVYWMSFISDLVIGDDAIALKKIKTEAVKGLVEKIMIVDK